MTTIPLTATSATSMEDDKRQPSAVHSESEEPPSTRRLFFPHVSDSEWCDWRWQFRNRITSVKQLRTFLPLTDKECSRLELVTNRYPLAITPYYLSLIDVHNVHDPVRKQAVPSFDELALSGMGTEDPLEEVRDSVVPGLVCRYPDRALMVITDICPMFCRHCTRKREWKSGGWTRTCAEVDVMCKAIAERPAIKDVIISGGDPLTLSTSKLEDVLIKLRAIPSVEVIRIGTRYPVVLPQRIDNELCTMLSRYSPIWLNTHFNHMQEVTKEAATACDLLLRAGIPVNNQSVLLRGVNDSIEAQMQLCRALLRIKVRPYYLFQADEVQGTEHLRTTIDTGLKILEGMRGRISGLAIPTYVVDLPGGGGKVPLQPEYCLSQIGDTLTFRNYCGQIFHYREPRAIGQVMAKKNGHTQPSPASVPTQVRKVKHEDRTGVRS